VTCQSGRREKGKGMEEVMKEGDGRIVDAKVGDGAGEREKDEERGSRDTERG